MKMIDPFSLLCVNRDTSTKDIKKAYYELALLMHPDRGGSTEDMDVLHKAYSYVLEDKEKHDKSVVEIEEAFQRFCLEKKNDVFPKFRDIFDECVFDTKEFNRQFDSTIIEGRFFPACLPGGYEEGQHASMALQVFKEPSVPLVDESVKLLADVPFYDKNVPTDYSAPGCTDYLLAYCEPAYSNAVEPPMPRTLQHVLEERECMDRLVVSKD